MNDAMAILAREYGEHIHLINLTQTDDDTQVVIFSRFYEARKGAVYAHEKRVAVIACDVIVNCIIF